MRDLTERAARSLTLSTRHRNLAHQSFRVRGVLACAIATAVATPLSEHFDLANIVMVFLLAVVVVAAGLGRGPAVLASLLSVAAFDFFYVQPRFSFSVSDVQYLLTFGVMLVVALNPTDVCV